MGKISFPEKVKLIMGVLYNDKVDISEIYNFLITKFGEMDIITKAFRFEFTEYYNKEMGKVIFRQYLSFKNLISISDLSDIKIWTNDLEEKNSFGKNRNINIDPGYIELGKLVLASTKNYTHRIYIGKGIFAEPTLQFYKKTFTTFPFSYPDYSDSFAINYFNEVREKYKEQLRR